MGDNRGYFTSYNFVNRDSITLTMFVGNLLTAAYLTKFLRLGYCPDSKVPEASKDKFHGIVPHS